MRAPSVHLSIYPSAGKVDSIQRAILVWDSIELGCGISRLRLGSAPEARASAPVGPMSSGSYDNYSDPNPNTLSSALQGSYPDFPSNKGTWHLSLIHI